MTENLHYCRRHVAKDLEVVFMASPPFDTVQWWNCEQKLWRSLHYRPEAIGQMLRKMHEVVQMEDSGSNVE